MNDKKNALMKTNVEVLDHKKLGEYLDVMGLGNKLNEKEKKQFFEISSAFGLNPFKREIYCTKYGETLSIIVGYETYIKRAERSALLDGWEVRTEGSVIGSDLKAIITIYRKDRSRPFVHEVHYSEYVQNTRDGHPNKFWREKPITMTKKVAIAQGFRLCFSDEIGGMPYTAEEITEEAPYQDVSEKTSQKAIKEKEEPVKITVVEPTAEYLNEALEAIGACNTAEELKNTWTKYKTVQKNPMFLSAKNAKKQQVLTSEEPEESNQSN